MQFTIILDNSQFCDTYISTELAYIRNDDNPRGLRNKGISLAQVRMYYSYGRTIQLLKLFSKPLLNLLIPPRINENEYTAVDEICIRIKSDFSSD